MLYHTVHPSRLTDWGGQLWIAQDHLDRLAMHDLTTGDVLKIQTDPETFVELASPIPYGNVPGWWLLPIETEGWVPDVIPEAKASDSGG